MKAHPPRRLRQPPGVRLRRTTTTKLIKSRMDQRKARATVEGMVANMSPSLLEPRATPRLRLSQQKPFRESPRSFPMPPHTSSKVSDLMPHRSKSRDSDPNSTHPHMQSFFHA